MVEIINNFGKKEEEKENYMFSEFYEFDKKQHNLDLLEDDFF